MTYAEAIAAAAAPYAAACDTRDSQTPAEAAEAAWYPGHAYSRQEIADLISEQRDEARKQDGRIPA